MTKQPADLNDSLDDLLDAPAGEVRTAIHAPIDYTPKDFSEPCSKCRGTGRFVSYSGRTLGPCFACKGAGKHTFKTSPEARAKARISKADRKAQEALEWVEQHAAEMAWVNNAAARGFEFAVSLRAALTQYHSLTDGQLAAVQKLMARDAERAAERAATAPVVETAGVDRLKAAFDFAISKAAEKGRGFRNPRITIGGAVISPAGANSKNPGALYVKSGGEYLGKIASGRFFAARECTPEQEKKILAFVADPEAAAKAYGQETGVCCICNATLTNKESIEAGIGPICGSRFGW
jgi:hypothetical protein